MERLYGDLGQAIAGQKFGLNDETETIIAGERLYPGDPIFQKIGDEEFGYGAGIRSLALTASDALVDGNAVTVTVNGVTLEPVSFVESSPETFRRIASAINLSSELREIGVTAFLLEGNALAFFVTASGATLTASATVAGGASEPTFTSATGGNSKFRGVARHMDISFREGAGLFPSGHPVSVMTRGHITVRVADSANPDNLVPAYVIMSGDDVGKFTHVATGNYDCGCFFRSSRLESKLALIEVNGLK